MGLDVEGGPAGLPEVTVEADEDKDLQVEGDFESGKNLDLEKAALEVVEWGGSHDRAFRLQVTRCHYQLQPQLQDPSRALARLKSRGQSSL